MKRISVVGNSGSGKTTFAKDLATTLDVPRLELDAVFHQPGWEPLERQLFRQRIEAFTSGPAWVADGNYSAVRDIIWDRADTVIWLDPSRSLVMRRVIWRTVRRMATRAELWNGNREPWSNLYRFSPEQNIIAWAWTSYRGLRQRYEAAMADPANGHLTFVRVPSAKAAADLIRACGPAEPL